MISKDSDIYFTPSWVKNLFSDWFDPCKLSDGNLREYDGLGSSWKKKTFVNPPYSDPLPWVDKAINEMNKGNIVVMLLNVDNSTRWYKKLVEANAHFIWFAERLSFSNIGKASKPSMLVILQKDDNSEQEVLF